MAEHECHICSGAADEVTCTKCNKAVCVTHRIACESCWDPFCTKCGRKCGNVEYCNYHADLYCK